MTAKLHKLIGTAMLGLALFSQSLPAWAGVAVRKEVYISPSRHRRTRVPDRGAL